MNATRPASLGPQQRPLTGNRPKSNFLSGQLENDNKVEAQLNIKKAVSKDAELMTQLKENQDLYRLWVMPDIEIDQHNN